MKFYILKFYEWLKLGLHQKTQIVYVDGPQFFNGPNQHSEDPKYFSQLRRWKLSINLTSPFSTLTRSIVDEKAKMIVFYSLKCGCTSLKYFAIDELNLHTSTHKKHKLYSRIPSIFENTNENILQINSLKEYEKFIVMRNPYDRIVSFFMNKILRNNHIPHNSPSHQHLSKFFQLHWHLTKEVGQESDINPLDISFRKFVHLLKVQFDSGQRVFDNHLSLQITPDMDKFLIDQTIILSMEQHTELQNYWYKQHKGVAKKIVIKENQSWPKELSKDIHGAADIPIKELIKLDYPIKPSSFYDSKIEEQVKHIYSSDYAHWNTVKPNAFSQ